MAITTSIARHYAVRAIVATVLCVGFAAWGAYDLWVKIPREEVRADRFDQVTRTLQDFEVRGRDGPPLTEQERAQYQALSAELALIAPGGRNPERPAAFDRLVCWLFISCIVLAPWFGWRFLSTRRRVYRLDDGGTLSMPEGTWAREDIAGIDMSRWMAKSVAIVEHRDGQRVKLDAYLHKDLELIIGRLASERHPETWQENGRLIASGQDAADVVEGARAPEYEDREVEREHLEPSPEDEPHLASREDLTRQPD